MEKPAAYDGGDVLGEGAGYHHDEHDDLCCCTCEERPHIHQHTYANQEIRNEDGVADKLNAVVEWSGTRYVAVEHQSGKERAEDAFQPAEVGCGCCEEHHAEHEDELHDSIGISAEEPSDDAREEEEQHEAENGEFTDEK